MTDVDPILAALARLGEDMREKFAELAEDLTGKINRGENLSFVSREIILNRLSALEADVQSLRSELAKTGDLPTALAYRVTKKIERRLT